MKNIRKKSLFSSGAFIFAFVIWTIMIKTIDVQAVGVNDTEIGFATINKWVHSLTGVNMTLYTITDWLGLVPVLVCILFGFMGFIQLTKRKGLLKVDSDIILLGVYYVIVIFAYLIFEEIPINYRPILINGIMESSYPSSTTLLVLSVMPTLAFQANCRINNSMVKRAVVVTTTAFSAFMVIGRLLSGVHWITDIIGSILLSSGLFYAYKFLMSIKIFR